MTDWGRVENSVKERKEHIKKRKKHVIDTLKRLRVHNNENRRCSSDVPS